MNVQAGSLQQEKRIEKELSELQTDTNEALKSKDRAWIMEIATFPTGMTRKKVGMQEEIASLETFPLEARELEEKIELMA